MQKTSGSSKTPWIIHKPILEQKESVKKIYFWCFTHTHLAVTGRSCQGGGQCGEPGHEEGQEEAGVGGGEHGEVERARLVAEGCARQHRHARQSTRNTHEPDHGDQVQVDGLEEEREK